MSYSFKSQAEIYAYDIRNLLTSLEGLIDKWSSSPVLTLQYNDVDKFIDLWFNYHLHHFDAVSVLHHQDSNYPAHVINAIKETHPAVELYYKMLYIPPHLSGRMVVLKRIRNVLWVVFIDPATTLGQIPITLQSPI